MTKHGAFDDACAARPGVEILSQEALGDGSMATTLRTRGGQMTITDGPFAVAAEQIGGYYLLARSRILALALNTSYALGRER